MRLGKTILATLWTLLIISYLPEVTTGQRLYDAKRDEEAQGALKIVTDLQSGSLFDKQLKNLSLLAKRDMEASLAAAKARMRSDINSFTTWSDVNCVVGRVNRNIRQVGDSDEIEEKLTALKQQIAELKLAFTAMKRATECKLTANSENIDLAKCPEMKPGKFATFFEHAGQLEDIDEAARALGNSYGKNKDITGALEQAKSVVAALKRLYDNYQERMAHYNNLQGELLDIQLQLKKVALQALQVEEQHLKSIIKIRARRETEEADIIAMIDDYEAYSNKYSIGFDRNKEPPCSPDEPRPSGHRGFGKLKANNIEMLLRDLVAKVKFAEKSLDQAKTFLAEQEFRLSAFRGSNLNLRTSIETERNGVDQLAQHASVLRDELTAKLFSLHLAAAISARGEIPRKLAALREAREDHAYSIRKSGVMARAYQLTVSGGVKRLALYHKGGIKPSKIAELVHAAATVAIPPVLAGK